MPWVRSPSIRTREFSLAASISGCLSGARVPLLSQEWHRWAQISGQKACEDQWILRTCFAKNGQGIAQIFVWGEQPLPEVIELKQIAKEEEEERERLRLEKEKREADEAMDFELPKARQP